MVKDNRNSIRKEVLHLIKFVKKTVAIPKQRKTVETVFSSLEKLGCQNFNSRSVKGLESRFESILLAYSVLLSRAQRRFEGTLRYSLGY
ncbi:transposase [Enterococcus faecium]|uniref:transposase n=2 Tax=Enterococcus TaxID=1350 RepID=UPI0021169193|nr:transposase [Enterococcus faecium]UYT91340.1 transposase [Enterococcus faecium]WSI02589.1 transposase [Enterococcus faecium]